MTDELKEDETLTDDEETSTPSAGDSADDAETSSPDASDMGNAGDESAPAA